MDKLAYTLPEAAEELSLGLSTVKSEVSKGNIKSKSVGRRVIIPRWALLEYLEQPKQPASGEPWDHLLEGE